MSVHQVKAKPGETIKVDNDYSGCGCLLIVGIIIYAVINWLIPALLTGLAWVLIIAAAGLLIYGIGCLVVWLKKQICGSQTSTVAGRVTPPQQLPQRPCNYRNSPNYGKIIQHRK